MENFWCTLIECNTPAYDETVRLRDEILRKPLDLEFTLDYIQSEYADYHIACYTNNFDLVGCLVLSPKNEEEIQMRQVAVDEAWQKKGIGKRLVEASEILAKEEGFKKMVMNARAVAIPFYTKLKYKKTGRPFTEVKIKHYKMFKKL